MPTSAASSFPAWLTPPVAIATGSLCVSLIALIATLLSLWWLHGRRSRLQSSEPHTYALHPTRVFSLFSITLPLAIHNPGAVPIIIRDVRLRLEKTEKQRRREDSAGDQYVREHADDYSPGTTVDPAPSLRPLTMAWVGTRPDLRISEQIGLSPPAVFAVRGRTAEQAFLEFEVLDYARDGRHGTHQATVDVKVSHKEGWERLHQFDLHLPLLEPDENGAVYRNLIDPPL